MQFFILLKMQFLLFFILVVLNKNFGQINGFNLNFQKITIEQGLSVNSFNDHFFQDSKGFIWISSIDGLNRFDGIKVKQYGAKNGMKGKNIQSDFFEDAKGNIWFSTYIGLNYYQPHLDSIINVPLCFDSGSLVENEFRVFYFNQHYQELWLKGGNKIFKINVSETDNYDILDITTNGFHFHVVENDTTNMVEQLMIAPWYGKGIQQINLEDGEIKKVAHYLQEIEGVKKTIQLSKRRWLLITETNLIVFDRNKADSIEVLGNNLEFKFTDAIFISKKHLLVTTLNNGLWLYNLQLESFVEQWQKEKNNSFSLSSNSPRYLHLQNELLLTGCNSMDVNLSYVFNNSFENPVKKISSKIIFLHENRNKIIWGNTINGKVAKISFSLTDSKKTTPLSIIERNSSIIEIKEGIDGYTLAHTKDSIFYTKSNLENAIAINNPDKLKFRYQISFFPNRTIITTTEGIKEIVRKDNDGFLIKDCPEFQESDGFDFSKIFVISNNKIYIPYNASELWIYYASEEGLVKIASVNCQMMIYSLTKSRKKSNLLWAGTSKGLVKITNDTIIQPVFDENSRMGNKTVWGVIEDNDGYLWMTTNKGLWQYHPETGVLNHYDEEDGLNGDIFSPYNSAMMSSQNEIWLGTNKGLIKFDPKKIKPYSIPPKVYIDQLLINDETEVKGIGVKDELVLKHDQNTLLFEVIPVLLYKADRAKVNYRLENYDGSWLSVKNGQKIRYTKIPPGKYTFKVMAEDVNGNQSEVKELAITVQPHFTQTWWFYLLATFATGLLMYAIYRYRVAQIKEDQAKKTAIAQLELQVAENELKALRAQMNPHFLFNAMNSIKGIIIQQEVNSAIEYLTKFSMLIRTILSNSEKKSILLKNELEALQLYIELEALRFTGSFKFQINVDRTVDKSYVRIPPLILQPFVENAIWHGLMPKGDTDKKLLINIFRKDDFVLCEIEDNGIGRKKSQERNRKKKHNSMGIGITEKRIKMLHPDNEVFIVDLEDAQEQGSGTKVIVKIFAPD